MRDIDKHFLKLLMLADHLNSDQIKNDYHNLHYLYVGKNRNVLIGTQQKYYFIFPQMVRELPYVFSEWQIRHEDSIYYMPSAQTNFYYTMCEFFGLTIEEYIHLFCPENQNTTKYGGIQLTKESTTREMAENIMAFLNVVLEEIYKLNQNCNGEI